MSNGSGKPGEDEHVDDERSSDDDFLRNVARVPSRTPPPEAGSLVGVRVDHFLVRAKLGAGGMGVVYEAEDEKLGRIVALKVLPNVLDPEARHRFVREARAASRIVHPNVATIYESGETEQGAYIAMEYVRGETLRAWLRTPRTIAARIRIVRQIASALAEAHAAGIVHRDLKPDNVLVTPAEGVKVLDFGLAKQRAGAAVGPGFEETATAEGQILGTPSYMSPEQAKGMAVDARSDVFSFGVLLYEVFTGARPFQAGTALGVLIAIDRDEPLAPTRINAETPVAIERIIGRALEKSPEKRYADGAELLRELEAVEGPLSPDKAAPVGTATWFKLVIAAGILVEVIALFVFVRGRGREALVAPSSVAGDAAIVGRALTDFPPYGSKNDEAVEAYRRGQQYVRSAMRAGTDLFARAASLDPNFAEAHLRVALGRVDGDDFLGARPDFREAKLRRVSLAPRDRALLDAFEPTVERSPADLHETAVRMRDASTRFADDAEITYFTAVASARDASAGAAALYERALALDPGFARALLRLADAEIASGRVDRAETAIDRCLAIAPDSVLCMADRAELASQRGACAEQESEARRMLTVAPDWMTARSLLGSALLGEGRAVAAVRELVDQGVRQGQDGGAPEAAFTVLLMQSEADLVAGDFEASLARFRAFEPTVAPLAAEDPHALVAVNEVILLAEMGRDEEARAVARDFLARHDAWEPNPIDDARGASSDYSVALAAFLGRAGVLSKRDVEAVRAAEIDRWMKRARTSGDREIIWVMAYVTATETAEEAKEAFAALPTFGALPDVLADPQANTFTGHALLLAGRLDEAVPRLERSTRACDLLGQAWPHLRAFYDLGRLREAQGDPASACAAYASLLARWKNAKPRSVTGERALARSKALRCDK